MWPVKPVAPANPTEERAMAEVESLAFDPNKAFEWPDDQVDQDKARDPALK
jgi:hypothetical protein